jgi:hypothetical protein
LSINAREIDFTFADGFVWVQTCWGVPAPVKLSLLFLLADKQGRSSLAKKPAKKPKQPSRAATARGIPTTTAGGPPPANRGSHEMFRKTRYRCTIGSPSTEPSEKAADVCMYKHQPKAEAASNPIVVIVTTGTVSFCFDRAVLQESKVMPTCQPASFQTNAPIHPVQTNYKQIPSISHQKLPVSLPQNAVILWAAADLRITY